MIVECIVPVYNEELAIKQVLSELLKSGVFAKIIVVDDGSTDSTRKVVKDFINKTNQKNVELLKYDKNMGKGYAISIAIGRLSGDITLLLDGDILGYNKKNLVKLIKPLMKSDGIYTTRLKSLSVADKAFAGIMGVRGYKTKDLFKIREDLESFDSGKYGIEVFLNYKLQLEPVFVVFDNSRHIYKPEKRGGYMIVEYLVEVGSIIRSWISVRFYR